MSRVALAGVGAIALMVVSQVRAADPDDAALRQEVKGLQEMVRELQARVSQLEGHSPVGAPFHANGVPEHEEAPNPASAAPVVAQTATPVVPQAAPIEAAPVVGVSAGYLSPEAALKVNWSKVAKDMAQDDVTRLLGTPSKKSTLDGRTVWYYYYPGTGSGSVFFTDAGRVSSRQAPFGFGW